MQGRIFLVLSLLGNQVIYKERDIDSLVFPAARVWIVVSAIGVGVGKIKAVVPGSVDGRAERDGGCSWGEDGCDWREYIE